PNRGGQASAVATPSGCPAAAQSGGSAFAYRVSAADPSRPGQELLLSASQESAAAGTAIQIYAVLTVPSQAIGVPGAAAATVPPVPVAPCLSVSGLSASSLSVPNRAAAPGVEQPEGGQQNSIAQGPATASGAETLTIPAGTAPGTVFHVVASVPANYPGSAQASFRVSLAITVR
ncbi:MAG TPA: hypothetical protein VF155_05025, partial [Candidatus Dormibacteraeota bacterium]